MRVPSVLCDEQEKPKLLVRHDRQDNYRKKKELGEGDKPLESRPPSPPELSPSASHKVNKIQ